MTHDQINAVFDRVRDWPRERREEAAGILMLIEQQDASAHQLTDGQLAEVRRRRADTNAELLTFDEFDKRLLRFGILKY